MIAAIYAGRRIAVALGCLILVASTASAECAWVLWLAENPPPGPSIPPSAWTILEAHGNKKECEVSMNRLGGPTKGNSYMMCLPDTVDPRGAKR